MDASVSGNKDGIRLSNMKKSGINQQITARVAESTKNDTARSVQIERDLIYL